MKRRFLNVLVVIMFAAVVCFISFIDSIKISVAGGDLILDVSENFTTEIYTVKSIRTEELAENKTMMNRAEIISDIDDMISQLPNGVLDMLKPYTILVTEKDVVKMYHIINPSEMFSSFNMFKAVVVYDKKIVCLDANNLAYRDSIYHELAHVIDYSLDWISKNEEFTGIYEREIENFRVHISEYPYTRTSDGIDYRVADWLTVIDSPVEYFAESFNTYYLQNDILKEYCPETYSYINSLIKNLE